MSATLTTRTDDRAKIGHRPRSSAALEALIEPSQASTTRSIRRRRATSTGVIAWSITPAETDPRSIDSIVPWPRLPTTMRSAAIRRGVVDERGGRSAVENRGFNGKARAGQACCRDGRYHSDRRSAWPGEVRHRIDGEARRDIPAVPWRPVRPGRGGRRADAATQYRHRRSQRRLDEWLNRIISTRSMLMIENRFANDMEASEMGFDVPWPD